MGYKKIIKLDINLKKDIISYLLLIMQIVIICMELKYDYLFMTVVLAAVLILHKETIAVMVNMVTERVKQICRKK